MIFAMYLVVAEQQGADWATLSGTIQNDILKEFIAQKEYIFPPRPSMRLITDIFAFCAREVPRVEHDLGQRIPHPRSRRDRRAGAGVHAARRHRVRAVGRRRRAWTSTRSCRACRSSSTRTATSSRRSRSTARPAQIWAHVMRDRFGAHDERSWKLRFHTQTAGVSLTAQQPYNNVVAHGAAGAVGGARRDQFAAHQLARRGAGAADRGGGHARAAHAADHRVRERRDRTSSIRSAGRTFVERLTQRSGGRGAGAISTRSIGWAAWWRRSSAAFRSGRSPTARTGSSRRSSARNKIIVGVNDFVQEDEPPIQTLYIDDRRRRRAARAAGARQAHARRAAASRGRWTRCARRPPAPRNTDAAAARRRARLRDHRRDVRRAPRGLGRVRRIPAI